MWSFFVLAFLGNGIHGFGDSYYDYHITVESPTPYWFECGGVTILENPGHIFNIGHSVIRVKEGCTVRMNSYDTNLRLKTILEKNKERIKDIVHQELRETYGIVVNPNNDEGYSNEEGMLIVLGFSLIFSLIIVLLLIILICRRKKSNTNDIA